MADESIFAPRSAGGVAAPLPQELNDFLETTVMEAVGEPHLSDLIRYRRLLSQMETFLSRRGRAADPGEIDGRIVFGVHRHARFLNRELLLAAGQYKYHLHALAGLDFAGPAEFIAAAEERRKRLRKTKLSDVERLMRLEEMVRERQKMLEDLGKRWDRLAAELLDLAAYVQENLERIGKACRRSIGTIVAAEVLGRAEGQLAESVKEHFKTGLRAALTVRKVTTGDVAQAKRDAAGLIAELSGIIRDDAFRMAGVYESLHEHVKRAAAELAALIRELGASDRGGREGPLLLFRRIERTIASLLSAFPADIEPSKVLPRASSHAVVARKRQEMHDLLFTEVRRDRRTTKDRRERRDRRKRQDPDYTGPERRGGQDRRMKGRRA
jgi:hypothetical protein